MPCGNTGRNTTLVLLDLGLAAFPAGTCTRTLVGKADMVLWLTAADVFRIEVWRSLLPTSGPVRRRRGENISINYRSGVDHADFVPRRRMHSEKFAAMRIRAHNTLRGICLTDERRTSSGGIRSMAVRIKA